jgi:hypothetical protein
VPFLLATLASGLLVPVVFVAALVVLFTAAAA